MEDLHVVPLNFDVQYHIFLQEILFIIILKYFNDDDSTIIFGTLATAGFWHSWFTEDKSESKEKYETENLRRHQIINS